MSHLLQEIVISNSRSLTVLALQVEGIKQATTCTILCQFTVTVPQDAGASQLSREIGPQQVAPLPIIPKV